MHCWTISAHARDDDRDSGFIFLQILQQRDDLLPIVEGALNDRSVRHAAQNIVHGGIVDVACLHVAEIDRAMFIADAQELLSLGGGALFIDARCRATQDDKVVFQALRSRPVGASCVSWSFLLLFLSHRT